MAELTVEVIDAMEAGREFDALIAERLLGWEHCFEGIEAVSNADPNDAFAAEIVTGLPPNSITGYRHLPRYSTDIAAAWEVVEHMRALLTEDGEVVVVMCRDKWDCQIERSVSAHVIAAYADTAPLAICRAALLTTLK